MQVRKFVLVFGFLIGCMPLLKAQKLSTQQYISVYKDLAISEMKRTGVPASIKLAQGILETQSGNGWLVLNSNNHFGIKCKNNWTGASVSYDDDARNECFRKYSTASDSYRDHSEFLKNNPRYSFLFQFQADDYKSWAYGLKQAGYATSKTYPQQLIKIIEDYNLQQYTLEGEGIVKAGSGNRDQADAAPDTRAYQPGRAAAVTPAAAPAKAGTASVPQGVFEINSRKVLFLPAGTALIEVANKHKKKLRNLVRYNDLPNDNPLPKDMFIYLEKKGKSGKDDYHVVAAGESMYDIAQAEGIQLRWLRRRNKMIEGQEPLAGQKLALGGYASGTPRLAKAAPKEDPTKGDFSPREVVNDVKAEIERQQEIANQQAAQQATAAPAQQPAQQQQSGLPAGMMEDLKKVADVTPGSNTARNTSPKPATAPAAPATAPTPQATAQYHDVQPKETLYGIAKRYNVSVEQLQQWNHLEANDIKIGQRLQVGKM